jgi:hypothetical protein
MTTFQYILQHRKARSLELSAPCLRGTWINAEGKGMAKVVRLFTDGERQWLERRPKVRCHSRLVLAAINMLYEGFDRLPKRSQGRASELFDHAFHYGLGGDYLPELDRLIETMKREKKACEWHVVG